MTKIILILVTTVWCFFVSGLSQSDSSQKSQVLVKYEDKLVTSISFSPDGKLLACGLYGSILPGDKNPAGVDLRDSKTGSLLFELKAEFGALSAMSFSPDGRFVAAIVHTGGWPTGGDSGNPPWPKNLGAAYLWDVKTGTLKSKLIISRAHAISLAFSPDSRYAAIGAGDNTIHLWDLSTGQASSSVYSPGEFVFSLNGKTLATTSDGKSAKLWDISAGKLKHAVNSSKSKEWISAVAFSPLGNRSASADKGRLSFWKAESRNAIRILEETGNAIGTLKFSPDSKMIAANSNAPGIVVMDITKAKITKKIETMTTEAAFDFTPDGKYLAICNSKDYHYELGPFASTIELYKF